jgi:hypothetical protein
VMPRTAKPKVGVPEAVQLRTTQPIRGMSVSDLAPRRISTLQIPPIQDRAEEPLARAPRATPFHLAPAVTAPPRVEERTPGSPIVLPANPFTNLSDASLEGFVDCRLFEAKGALAEPITPTTLADGSVRGPLEVHCEPTPLPPPPPRHVEAVPARPTPIPYAHTRLPDLNVPGANDRVSEPLIKRRTRNHLLIAVVLGPLLGAAAVVGYLKLAESPATTIASLAPSTLAAIEVKTSATAAMEPAPPAPAVTTQPIHAVLVKTYPIAAKVTVAGRSFGTTPTYIKIPANTPVSVRMERAGFKPVTYPLTSKRPTDRVFVRLQRRGRR